jgi:Rod binding domain-containing protein
MPIHEGRNSMTSLLALAGVGVGGALGAADARAVPVAAPARITAPAASFAASLDAVRAEKTQTIGQEFEASALTPFLSALLPQDGQQVWGGSAGAMWRGLFAERLAADLAANGGVGIAALVDRSVAARESGK